MSRALARFCAALLSILCACAPASRWAYERDPALHPTLVDVPVAAPAPASVAPIAPIGEARCSNDLDCGLDVALDRCVADPRANPQPPLVDQGIVCFCDRDRCATLRVTPIPCESDASCTVSLEPRPHPLAAPSRSRRSHAACVDDGSHFVFSATCERTNICTMKRSPRGDRACSKR